MTSYEKKYEQNIFHNLFIVDPCSMEARVVDICPGQRVDPHEGCDLAGGEAELPGEEGHEVIIAQGPGGQVGLLLSVGGGGAVLPREHR